MHQLSVVNTLNFLNNNSHKTIVLLTTGQPASNPRLVKEANALCAAGYRTLVLYVYWTDWAQRYDKEIIKSSKWEAIQVGGTPEKNRSLWMMTRIRRKVASLLPGWLPFAKRTICRAYDELLKQAIKVNADLYIAHNLGALPVAARAANTNKVPYGFDAEDYHRGETPLDSQASQLAKKLEEQYFPGAAYLTAASPMIGATYQDHFDQLSFQLINNVFSRLKQPDFQSLKDSESLKLFWFSQSVGTNRGIQEVLLAMNRCTSFKITLTLIGTCSREYQQYFTSLLKSNEHQIEFIEPVFEDELFKRAGQHHIGLALERNEPDNRRICLTNKIFTYLLAGNAIIASETDAQKKFMTENPGVGKTYPIGNVEQLTKVLQYYCTHPKELLKTRQNAWQLAVDKYNWEIEQKKFLNLVKSVI